MELLEKDKPIFQPEGALSPDDRAYEGSIYNSDEVLGAAELFEPQVIASPSGSGKTTMVNTIHHSHSFYSPSSEVKRHELEIPKLEPPLSERGFRAMLVEELLADEDASLYEILRTSRVFDNRSLRNVFVIREIERLETKALHWLLSGLKYLQENPDLVQSIRVQVIVDGAATIQALTAGPDSPYPINRQLYPPEFEQGQQRRFVEKRLDWMEAKIELDAFVMLWNATHGDKALTQVICSSALKKMDDSGKMIVDENMVRQLIREFINHPGRKTGLQYLLLTTLAKCSYELKEIGYHPIDVWSRIGDLWSELPDNVQKMAYGGGLVRRRGATDLRPVAPIIIYMAEVVERRLQEVEAVLRSRFSLLGVKENNRSIAAAAVYRIIELAGAGTLSALHVGIGRMDSSDEAHMDVIALRTGF